MIFSSVRDFAISKILGPRAAAKLTTAYVELVTSNDYYTPPPTGSRELLKLYSDHPWVRSIVAKVSSGVAKQEWYFERANGERVDNHPALEFLRTGCPKLRGRQARKLTVAHVDLTGEAFWIIGRKGANNSGPPVQFAPIPPDWVLDVADDENGFFEIRPKLGHVMKIPARDVLYFRDPDPLDPYGRGVGITRAARTEISTDATASKYLDMYLKNSARPDLIISGEKDSPIGKDDRPRLEAHWNEKHRGAMRSGRPYFSSQPLKVTELGKGLRDNQFSEIRGQLKGVIAEIYGVPPEIFGRLENSNRATIDSADYLFGKHTLQPRLDFLHDYLAPWLAENFNTAGLVLKFVSPVEDDTAFALEAVKARPSAYSDNEVRALSKHKPVTGGEVRPAPVAPGGPGKDDKNDDRQQDDKPAEKSAPAANVEASAAPAADPVTKQIRAADIVSVSSAHEDPQVRAQVSQLLDDIFEKLLDTYGSELLGELSETAQFRQTAGVVEWLAKEVPTMIGQIDGTTRDALRASLVEGAAVNETVEALAQRVAEIFDAAAETRAVLIGQTIATKITGFGALEASKQAGFEVKKWLSSQDQVVRPTHVELNGQTQPIGQPFRSKSGAAAQHPGAFGKAAEDVNCRCAIRPIVHGEKALAMTDDAFRAFHAARFDKIAKEASATVKTVFSGQKAVALYMINVLGRLP